MMVNFAQLFRNFILINFTIISLFSFCKTPPGPLFPTYKNIGMLKDLVPALPSQQNFLVYTFSTYNQIYKKNLISELILLEKTYIEQSLKISKLSFILRTLSKDRKNSIKLRIYRGIAHYDQKSRLLDLHAQNCYVYEKKEYSDRFYPVEGWTCDHLIFLFYNHYSELIPISSKHYNTFSISKEDQYRISRTHWFLISNPRIPLQWDYKKPLWYATLIEETHDTLIFFGYNANIFLKNNNKVSSIFQKSIPIKKVVGDFVFINKNQIKAKKIKNIFSFIYKKRSFLF